MKEELTYWIAEREAIRKKKEAGMPKPWTDDPVFQTTYFCNVHREDDKVTRYVRKAYMFGEPNLIPRLMMARLVNRIPSLEFINPMYQWNEELFRQAAEKLKPFWGNAYVVTTHGRKMSKVDYACEVLAAAFGRPWPIAMPTLKTAHGVVSTAEGFGSFMAAQVVADLKNTPDHPLQNATDWRTWSAPGPGSLRGLRWYYGRPVTATTYNDAILGVAEDINWEGCMQDLQNCMCEFDKYMRVKNGTGRSKRKYQGTA